MPHNHNEGQPNRDNPLFIGALEKGVKVMDVFRDVSGSLSMTEICKYSGLGKSAVQRFCFTLVELGLLIKDPASKRYSPSPQLLDYSYSYLKSDPIVQIATPYLIEAREKTGEAMNMAKRVSTDVIYNIRLPSTHSRLANPLIGGRAPVFCTASGRAMLSTLSTQHADEILQRCERKPLTPYTIVDKEKIHELLKQAQENGYTVASQECIIGEITIAAPIFDRNHKVVASINIATSLQQFNEQTIREELAPVISRVALDISRAIGLSPFA